MATSSSLSATGSDGSHNLPGYGRDHSQDPLSHAYPQSPPVETSATNDLLHSHGSFNCTTLGDIAFPPSSDTSAAKAKPQQFAPIIPPQNLAHAIHPDTYHVARDVYRKSAGSQSHASSACPNGAVPPEPSHPAPHGPRYFSSTLDGACLGPHSRDPSHDLAGTTTRHAFADFSSIDFSRNPVPMNDPSGFNNPQLQQPASPTEPKPEVRHCDISLFPSSVHTAQD
ncbi:hypothetical protein IMSHALPRED_003691 [Imshaugia aleurites]|uniref:Uncharacterized protein n=1 Tax=Imshaugia aleurites TaxID=172621 RepID=A0A8H3J836_9LECA|nr:hypothetical protein IMSHALPRED_003691 [Imshaugia aleurites]